MLGIAGILSPAAAQETAQNTDHVQATLTGRVLYDSNVARSDRATAASRGISPDDVIFSPTLALDASRTVAGFGVFLRGLAGYDFYRRNDHLNRENIDLSSGATTRFFIPCQQTVSGNYARRQSDLLDLTTAVTENVETIKSVALDLGCNRPVGFSPSLTASETWTGNSSAALRTSDAQTFSTTLDIGYNQPVIGKVSAFGRFTRTDFLHRVALVGTDLRTDGLRSYTAGLRYSRPIGATLDVSISPSYTSLDPVLPNISGFQGFSYEAQLGYRPITALRMQLSFERTPRPLNRPDVTYALQQTTMLVADYSLGTRWSFQLGGSHTSNDFHGTFVNPLDIRNEKLNEVFGVVRYALTNDLSVSLDSRRQDRDANISQFNYVSYQVSLSVRAAF